MKRVSIFTVFFLFFSHIVPTVLCSDARAEQTTSGPNYSLGPEDVLEISVWKDEALTKQVVVRPDGWLSFPLIGDVLAAGRTVEELRQEIKDRIKSFVPDAPVTVMVLQVGSRKVFVVGKVAQPGVYVMGAPMRVMQALAMAGGTTTFADTNDILIIRKDQDTQRTYTFNYSNVARGKDLEQNINLMPGDTIVVP